MKRPISYLFVAYIFCCYNVSCNSSDEENNNGQFHETPRENEKNDSSLVEDEFEDGFFLDEFTFEEFPKQWLQLTPLEGYEDSLVIEKYCDAEVAMIDFMNKDGKTVIYTGYGQDGEEWTMANFEGTKKTEGGSSMFYGSFDAQGYSDTLFITFDWSPSGKICWFEGFSYTNSKFVSVENKEHYHVISPDCEGFWE